MLKIFPQGLLLVLAFLSVAPSLRSQGVDLVLKSILDSHTETRGGILKMNALGALHIEGRTSQQGQDYRFVIFKKRPDLIRLSIEGEGETLLFGFDGKSAWKRSVVDGKGRTETLSTAEARVLREEASLESPLVNYLDKPENRVRYVGSRQFAEGDCYVIEVADSEGERSRFYLERNGYDLVRRDRLGPAGEVLLETRYSDYRNVGGYRFAFMIENFSGGKLVSLTEISDLKVNPGLLSFYFKPPL